MALKSFGFTPPNCTSSEAFTLPVVTYKAPKYKAKIRRPIPRNREWAVLNAIEPVFSTQFNARFLLHPLFETLLKFGIALQTLSEHHILLKLHTRGLNLLLNLSDHLLLDGLCFFGGFHSL